MSETALSRAREWARRLDEEEFDRLGEMMHPDCEYTSPQGVLTGPEAIVASYRKNAAWAHDTFDSIEWSSETAPAPDGRIGITFEDRTVHRGIRHVYHCRQLLDVDDDGRIARIEHVAIEEEERALAAFFERVGVER